MEIKRLDLAHVTIEGSQWPVHGYVILHEQLGTILVDTGCGGPEVVMRYFAVVNRTVAEALADHDLAPIDVKMVINTHLHFDHCGQNPAFEHAPLMVQRAEHERIFRERDEVTDWIEASGMRFELVDGEVQLADDLRIITTPGHTSGHQSVIATTETGTELFIGDAVYTRAIWDHASASSKLPSGQAADRESWDRTVADLRGRKPAKVHFCHDS
ncbi:MAG TPA: N-acyl homoserine lactonase family protein [Candidatus Dormibacteraeota bacterium]